MYKKVEETNLPSQLPQRKHEDVWRVWVYWLRNGKWKPHKSPSFYATEAGWRRWWAPKQRNDNSYFMRLNTYRRVVVEKLEPSGWVQVLDHVESNDDSTWKLEDADE